MGKIKDLNVPNRKQPFWNFIKKMKIIIEKLFFSFGFAF